MAGYQPPPETSEWPLIFLFSLHSHRGRSRRNSDKTLVLAFRESSWPMSLKRSDHTLSLVTETTNSQTLSSSQEPPLTPPVHSSGLYCCFYSWAAHRRGTYTEPGICPPLVTYKSPKLPGSEETNSLQLRERGKGIFTLLLCGWCLIWEDMNKGKNTM